MNALKEVYNYNPSGNWGGDEVWQPHYYSYRADWDLVVLEKLKDEVEKEISQFHPAVQKTIRIRIAPESGELAWPEAPRPYKTLVSPCLTVTVCEKESMLSYLNEPGVAELFAVQMERLDHFLSARAFPKDFLRRPNPDYVSPLQPGVRVIHKEHRDRGIGVIVGEHPDVPGWYQVRVDDGELLIGMPAMLELVPPDA